MIDPNGLGAAERALNGGDHVAHARQRVHGGGGDAVLHLHLALVGEQPRQVDRLLDV